MSDDKKINFAKKLQALADRGIGGEKKNAQVALENYLKKHNLSMNDLSEDKVEYFFYLIPEGFHRLFCQIVGHVNHELFIVGPLTREEKKIKGSGGVKCNFFLECTILENAEIDILFGLYSEHYKKELEVFFIAFVQTNELWSSAPARNEEDMTPEERRKRRKASAMSEGMDKLSRMKALTNGQ